MPEKTLHAFAEHGNVSRSLDANLAEAHCVLAHAAEHGIDLAAVTAQLEREGVKSFCDSYDELLRCIESMLGAPRS